MPEVSRVSVKLNWHGKKVEKDISALVWEKLFKAGELVKDEVIRSFKEDPKTGTFYYGRSGRYYQASAPGESPAIDTGSLMRSMSVMKSDDEKEMAVLVGTMDESKHDPQYKKNVSFWLELGTDKIAPRFFLRPALQKKTKEIYKIFEEK